MLPNENAPSASTHDQTPLIHAIPAEIFLDILLSVLDLEAPLEPQLHLLAQVCRYWFGSIIANPRLWRVIDYDNIHLSSIVMKRNPNGPLISRCHIQLEEQLTHAFWEVGGDEAHRWDVLDFDLCLEEWHLRFLRCPTPILETLNIRRRSQGATLIFPLSTISTFRHVEVRDIGLPWDSPTLSQLKSMSLMFMEGSSSPSLCQIITILHSSPALEWFALNIVSGATVLVGDEEAPEGRISLQALRGLYLSFRVCPATVAHLLKNIDAPRCRILEAPIPFNLIQNPGPAFTLPSTSAMQAARSIYLDYCNMRIDLDIRSTPFTYGEIHSGWRRENDETRLLLTVEDIPNAPRNLEVIIDVLQLPTNQIDLTLKLYEHHEGDDLLRFFDDHNSLSNFATTFHFDVTDGPHTIAILRFLAAPTAESGRTRWPCPRLVRLTFSDVEAEWEEELVDALVELLTKRLTSNGSQDVESPSGAPVPLECIYGPESIIGLIRKSKAANNVQVDEW